MCIRDSAKPDSTEDQEFIFPSTSSGATGTDIILHRKSSSVALTLPRNPFTSKTTSTIGDRLNLSAGQQIAFMGVILTEGGVPLEKAIL